MWLDPHNLPSPETLQCKHCTRPLVFILQVCAITSQALPTTHIFTQSVMCMYTQIYGPLDNVPSAFHRMVYLFCCANPTCLNHTDTAVVLRCQLPQQNQHWAHDPDTDNLDEITTTLEASLLCELCGCSALSSCSKCKQVHYCSKYHQKMHWKQHKQTCCADREIHTTADTTSAAAAAATGGDEQQQQPQQQEQQQSSSSCVLKEMDIVVEEEPTTDHEINNQIQQLQQPSSPPSPSPPQPQQQHQDTIDEDITHLTQNDLMWDERQQNTALTDPLALQFMTRVALSNDQVLRYKRWGSKPLWASIDARNDSNVVCSGCGKVCEFEFQVMPQLLYYLQHDGIEIDFGTVVVYTCPDSCVISHSEEASSSYTTEHAYVQPT